VKRLLALIPIAAILALAVTANGAPSGMTVIEHASTDATTDTGPTGDSAGDILTFANRVYDAADKKQVGTDQGYCVRVVAGAAYECTWTNLLAGGSIVVNGPFYDTKDSTMAITGGTGRYRNARGTMRLQSRAKGTKYAFTFKLD
jgi:hypothetical protein